MQMKRRKRAIINHFRTLNDTYNGTIPLLVLSIFINTNFKKHNIDSWSPPDFRNYPKIIDYIQDMKYK